MNDQTNTEIQQDQTGNRHIFNKVTVKSIGAGRIECVFIGAQKKITAGANGSASIGGVMKKTQCYVRAYPEKSYKWQKWQVQESSLRNRNPAKTTLTQSNSSVVFTAYFIEIEA
jgi:hypothetical protein